jgi:probable phosphoglycerate mutase
MQTADSIAMQCDLRAQVLPYLDDLDYGEWLAMTHEAVNAESPTIYRQWMTAPQLVRFPGGESLQDLLARAADAVRFAFNEHPRQTIVMVGHESLNRALLLHAMGQPLSAYWNIAQAPCAINEIIVRADRTIVVSFNQTAHLVPPSVHT